MPGPSREEVLSWFDSTQLNEPQTETLTQLRDCFKGVVIEILAVVPESADRTRALRTLQDAESHTVFAFTHNLET